MNDAHEYLDRTEIESFFAALAFVREYAINIVSMVPGQIAIELPFDERLHAAIP